MKGVAYVVSILVAAAFAVGLARHYSDPQTAAAAPAPSPTPTPVVHPAVHPVVHAASAASSGGGGLTVTLIVVALMVVCCAGAFISLARRRMQPHHQGQPQPTQEESCWYVVLRVLDPGSGQWSIARRGFVHHATQARHVVVAHVESLARAAAPKFRFAAAVVPADHAAHEEELAHAA